VLDSAKADLPLFVAADQKRLPPITVSGSDLGVLSVSIIEMKTQLKEMAAAQKQLAVAVSSMQEKMLKAPDKTCSLVDQAAEFPPLPDSAPLLQSADFATNNSVIESSWTGLVEALAAAGG